MNFVIQFSDLVSLLVSLHKAVFGEIFISSIKQTRAKLEKSFSIIVIWISLVIIYSPDLRKINISNVPLYPPFSLIR